MTALCFLQAKAAPPTQEELYEFGVRVHAMLQAYQSKDEKANIFIPLVSTQELEPSYLKQDGKICIFASGGQKIPGKKRYQRLIQFYMEKK